MAHHNTTMMIKYFKAENSQVLSDRGDIGYYIKRCGFSGSEYSLLVMYNPNYDT